ncbi:MAG: DUF5343 domain-containing protein [Bacilli bacterium]|nr:DUF5343 domain-containing protein [Bacilli bacterium]
MALCTSYLVTTKNLESLINSVLGAQAPERFTYKFLNDLGFTSSNDRLFVGVFKSLGLLDDNGAPTQRYYEFLDQTKYKKVLADGIKEAYSDLFNINKSANKLDVSEVKNKFKTLTQGQKTDKVLSLMAMTFKALCDLADFSIPLENTMQSVGEPIEKNDTQKEEINRDNLQLNVAQMGPSLHYDIHIHLPETRDDMVYDAIFKSIKKNLY